MTQTVPATAVLGPGKTGLAIGLRVLNLDGTEYAAFATTGVAETSVAGTYRKASGVVCPDAGGYIVWGTALVDYAEATVESTAVNVTLWAGDAVAAADGNGNVPTVLANAAHGGAAATLLLTSLQVSTTAPGADAVLISSGNYGGRAVRLQASNGTGLSVDGGVLFEDGIVLNDFSGTMSSGISQDVADALLLAPSSVAAAGSAMDYLADILEDTGTTLPALIAVGVGPGSSTGYYSDTVDDGSGPLDGVRVQLYTAQNRMGLAYEAYTNASGVFEMCPDPGTYYRWLDLAGYSGTQDVEVVVTEP